VVLQSICSWLFPDWPSNVGHNLGLSKKEKKEEKRKASVPTQAHLLDPSSDRLNRNNTFSHGQRHFAVIWLLAAKQVHIYSPVFM